MAYVDRVIVYLARMLQYSVSFDGNHSEIISSTDTVLLSYRESISQDGDRNGF
jgi:hypothetical protein